MDINFNSFKRTSAVLQRTVDEGLNSGGQIYVAHNGERVLHEAFGPASPGQPISKEMAIPWFSAGKPLTAIAIAQLVENKALTLDQPVATWIPEFGTKGKEAITARHLLTHTAGLRSADNVDETLSWENTIQNICDAPLDSKWVPGEKGAYSPRAAWFILAELIERLTRTRFEAHMEAHVFEPLGMTRSGFVARAGTTLAPVYTEEGGALKPALIETAHPRPGSSARGPIAELGAFYESLLRWPGRATVIGPEIQREFTSRQRVALYDLTFLHVIDTGLGFIISSNDYGPESVPYGYGRHCSSGTFGHSGVQCSCAFADPANELVVAWALNKQPGERLHQKRARDLNSAIYEDLGLA